MLKSTRIWLTLIVLGMPALQGASDYPRSPIEAREWNYPAYENHVWTPDFPVIGETIMLHGRIQAKPNQPPIEWVSFWLAKTPDADLKDRMLLAQTPLVGDGTFELSVRLNKVLGTTLGGEPFELEPGRRYFMTIKFPHRGGIRSSKAVLRFN